MTLKLVLIFCFLALTAFTAQPESRALPSGTVLATDDEGIWRIDIEAKTRRLYYRFPNPSETRFQGYFFDYTEQYLYAVEVPDSANWWQWQFGTFNLVKIDLLSGEKTTVYTGEDIGISDAYPNSKDFILLARYPQNYALDRSTPNYCLLDLRTTNCLQASEIAAGNFYGWVPEIWLGFDTFTNGAQVVDAFTNESPLEILNDDWLLPYASSLGTMNTLLLVLYPKDGSFPSEDGAAFYTLDMETFQLSNKRCDIPAFHRFIALNPSPDGNLVEYAIWPEYMKSKTIILDLNTCQTLLEREGIYGVWLPDSHLLIGRAMNEQQEQEVVTINVDTGEIEILFEIDKNLYFSVVP